MHKTRKSERGGREGRQGYATASVAFPWRPLRSLRSLLVFPGLTFARPYSKFTVAGNRILTFSTVFLGKNGHWPPRFAIHPQGICSSGGVFRSCLRQGRERPRLEP